MSPHGITGPPHQSSRNLGNECQLTRPLNALIMPIFVSSDKSVRDMRCRKFVLPEKWTKFHQNHLRHATPQYPQRCQS